MSNCLRWQLTLNEKNPVEHTDKFTAFEGHAHPYKQNIVKFGGKSVMGELPEIQKAFQQTREAAAAQ